MKRYSVTLCRHVYQTVFVTVPEEATWDDVEDRAREKARREPDAWELCGGREEVDVLSIQEHSDNGQ